ncbi:MAG TPA: hypothetical protein VMW37_02620 [Dehalococcoidales bacterium]|nr:hypothetical protein [Dehalococcoidales bacterium]
MQPNMPPSRVDLVSCLRIQKISSAAKLQSAKELKHNVTGRIISI